MHGAVADRLPAIQSLCRRYGVRSLFLFGSAASGGFDPDRSDIDLLVDFGNTDLGPWMRTYFEFQQDLESVLASQVALMTANSLAGRRSIARIDSISVPLYAA